MEFKLDIIQKIMKDYTHLTDTGKTIVMCWILSHVNIWGNERADEAAKSALSSSITNMKFPGRELTLCMSKFCLDVWQNIWNCCEKISFIQFITLLALLHIVKLSLVTIALSSMDFELVILT